MMKEIIWNYCCMVLLGFWGLVKIYYLYDENPADLPSKNYTLNQDYQKNVKVQIYYMTPEQVSDLYKTNIDEVPEHWQYQEKSPGGWLCTYKKPLYLVIRVKNEGDSFCLGKLSCTLAKEEEQKVKVIELTPNMNHFVNYVFFLTDAIHLSKLGYPDLKVKWESLYVKK